MFSWKMNMMIARPRCVLRNNNAHPMANTVEMSVLANATHNVSNNDCTNAVCWNTDRHATNERRRDGDHDRNARPDRKQDRDRNVRNDRDRATRRDRRVLNDGRRQQRDERTNARAKTRRVRRDARTETRRIHASVTLERRRLMGLGIWCCGRRRGFISR